MKTWLGAISLLVDSDSDPIAGKGKGVSIISFYKLIIFIISAACVEEGAFERI